MARIKCKCGQELSNSTNPEIQYKIFSDQEWIVLLDRIDQGKKLINIDGNKRHFWECPKCGRLYLFEDDNDKPLKIYQIDK